MKHDEFIFFPFVVRFCGNIFNEENSTATKRKIYDFFCKKHFLDDYNTIIITIESIFDWEILKVNLHKKYKL